MAEAAFALSGAAQSLVWSMHFYGWTDISFVIPRPPTGSPGRAGARRCWSCSDFFDIAPG